MKKKFLKLSAAAVAALHVVNFFIDSTLVYTTAKSSGKNYRWHDGDIFYRVSGQGKSLLLIHDLNVFSSGTEWNAVIDELSKDYTVYALDLPGCGKSVKQATTYTAYFYVQLITDFINEVIKEKPVVAATGLSSSFVLMADALDASLMSSFLFINPPDPDSLHQKSNRKARLTTCLYRLPVIGRSCYYMAVGRASAEYYFSEKCFYNPFELHQATIRAGYEAAHMGHGKGRYLYASLKGNYLNTNISSALKSSDKKITLVFGEYEEAEKAAASYQKIREDLTIYSMNKVKKLPQLEKPEEIAKMIRSAC